MAISGNFYLNEEQMLENALELWSIMQPLGWTKNAVAGMLGNIEEESTVNPGVWQNLEEGNLAGGYGLVQWTPASKYIDWCTANGYDRTTLDSAVLRFEWELANREQYYPTPEYPMTFEQFKASDDDPYILGITFCLNYERPGSPDLDERGRQAEKWFALLEGSKFKFIYYLKRRIKFI